MTCLKCELASYSFKKNLLGIRQAMPGICTVACVQKEFGPKIAIDAPTTPSLPTMAVSICSPVLITVRRDTIPLNGK